MAGIVEGKVILITGGGGGIGRATAYALAREGARLAIGDRDAEGGAVTRDAIIASGGEAVFIEMDVANEASVSAAVAGTVTRFGTINGAFNNAGISPQSAGGGLPITEMPLDGFRAMLDINLTGVFLCLKHEMRAMIQHTGGAIVNTASIAGLKGLPTAGSYTAAKHGVIGLTRTAAMEYARAGIRVNAVCPGFVATRMIEDAGNRADQYKKLVPQRRFGEPEEVAEAVVWLLSDKASFVTGAAWTIDGGLTA
jgi:NAD(P)-dependent dehydrogenase (short-subunit alcohol dehydrogenase family)